MFIRMLETIANDCECYLAGETYEPIDAIAVHFIRQKVAIQTTQPPEVIQRLLDRLDYGAGKTCLFLPFCGEFGHLVMTHLRIVHFHKASWKIVCCRPGEQVLFSSAHEYVIDWTDPVPDLKRIGTMRDHKIPWLELAARFPDAVPIDAGGLSPSQELHCINAAEPIPFAPRLRRLRPDVVLGVRHRALFPERNWQHWQTLADALTANGLTFATMGDKATSPGLLGQQYHTGDLDTDAAIESLQNCRLYIGTDTGASHLAATVRCPMAVFRTAKGNSRDLFPQMEQRNPGQVTILPPTAWNDPTEVISAATKYLYADRKITPFNHNR